MQVSILDDLRGQGVDVSQSPDLTRIRTLPRSTPANVEAYSRMLRKYGDDDRCPAHTTVPLCRLCGGSGRIVLRDEQASAIHQALTCRGLFAHMQVGSGKTIPTLVAPLIFGSQRPVMLLPSALFRKSPKTQRDFARYQKAWHVRLPRLVSYQELGHPTAEKKLTAMAPDLLIMDEADMLRSVESSVTRRVGRFIEANPATIVLALSGTLITGDLLDYHHHTIWALGQAAPMPLQRAEAERWNAAKGSLERARTGEVQDLPGGYSEWFRGTAGIVVTEGVGCPAEIKIRPFRPSMPAHLQATIEAVAASHTRPDGELLEDLDLPDCLSQLANGFYYVWDPLPPDWWLLPRRAWAAYVVGVLDLHLLGFDSPSLVRDALDYRTDPQPPDASEGRRRLAAWRAVKDRFEPNKVPIWITDDVIRQAIAHAKPGTLIWTGHVASGEMFERLGVPYYGSGRCPETLTSTPTIACSIKAHGTGKNLQAWNRALFMSLMANSRGWEQVIGREHRPGQLAPTVTVDIIQTIDYHADVIGRVLALAKKDAKEIGFLPKILAATWETR